MCMAPGDCTIGESPTRPSTIDNRFDTSPSAPNSSSRPSPSSSFSNDEALASRSRQDPPSPGRSLLCVSRSRSSADPLSDNAPSPLISPPSLPLALFSLLDCPPPGRLHRPKAARSRSQAQSDGSDRPDRVAAARVHPGWEALCRRPDAARKGHARQETCHAWRRLRPARSHGGGHFP